MKKWLVIIFVISFFIRLISLDQSLWLDEAITAKVLREFGLTQIISRFSPEDFHPPLYYLFMKVWTNLFGYSEVALRMPSVIFSLLTGWIVYLIAREVFPTSLKLRGAQWAAAFFLFNPLIVYYSQEARMYLIVTLFTTAMIYYLLRINELTNFKNIFFFNLFIVLAFFTFYGSIFFIAAIVIWLLIKKQYRFFLVSSFSLLTSLLIISPLLVQQFQNAQITTQLVANWKSVLGPVSLKNLLLIPVKFTTGRIDFHPAYAAWTCFILYLIIKNSIKIKNLKFKIERNNSLLIFLFLFPILLGVIFSFYTPLLQYFRFLYLVPIMSLLLAQVPPGRWDWRKRLILTGFVVFSLIYLLNPKFHREDWRSLAKSLPADRQVYMIQSSSDPLLYYRPKQEILDIRTLPAGRQELGIKNLDREIVVIPYTADIHGIDYRQMLGARGYVLGAEKTFRELKYEIWSLR